MKRNIIRKEYSADSDAIRGFGSRSPGFTLLETIIALGIFVTVGTIATSIFLSAQSATRRAVAGERLGGDARWVMERIVEDVRLGTVDYVELGKTSSGNILPLRTVRGEAITYAFGDDATRCGRAERCLALTRDRGATWARLTSENVAVERFAVFVWPEENPFIETARASELGQPRVTIVLETASVTSKAQEQARLALQTTVSTRIYKR